MVDNKQTLPSLICIVGVDGSGKTTLTDWLVDELTSNDVKSVQVWSRFRNYLSKPLLAITRLTGHNHYKKIDNVLFGFHDFENLIVYRELFAILQAVDVNIGAYFHIHKKRSMTDVVICERGPWDTLVDVASDTGMDWLASSKLGKIYGLMMQKDVRVFWVDRSYDNIIATRKELKHDYKLPKRIELYKHLADLKGWDIIDNNDTLDAAKQQIRDLLGIS